MPPKKKEMSKSEMKKVEKFVEDKTFGLKNKNKSKSCTSTFIAFR
jgi:zinc finger CCCH domain-containing protein 11